MFNTFAPNANHQPAIELIPANTLAFAIVTVQAVGSGQQTGGRNAKLELTISRGPYERRKIWYYLGDPTDQRNSEKYQQMSLAAMQHMLEAAGVFRHDQPETYAAFANADFTQILKALDGKEVAIKIKIDKGKDGYEDKNVVADWLSPNPASRSNSKWNELLQGSGAKPAAPAQGQVFTPPAAAAPANAPASTAGGVPAWLQK